MSVHASDKAPQPILWGNYNIFAYIPDVPGFAAKVLFHCLSHQEWGGRIVQSQQEIADWLGVSRSLVQKGLHHLQLARILLREGNGVYRMNPMVAAFPTAAEADQAIRTMDRAYRLDTADFADRYERAVVEHEAAVKQKAAARALPQAPADLAAHRQRKRPAPKG
ncbi:replication/maintenance protein RepL [Streptomyces sp. Isolate_45]|uniref:replication/maintenance protein RepL n=1 Tax=Streptomyces sp. Isolate_45 TaxID=2950111 RepID=UPI002481D3B1|nr:replication/maintenance protein RepL [Streptomyces sp. Isolate_45]MDA5279943.1 replication/maintenance protein RepL [Streptomyces sp. Isolate_45]